MALNFLLKRSGTASKRPVAASMALGEIDLNYDADTGGVYYKDSAGAVVKVGPAQVSATAPNVSPAGSSGNSKGEFWYDTANSELKMWDGVAWVATGGGGGGGVAGVTGTAPVTVDNTDPANPVVGVNAGSTTSAGVVQLNDTVTSTSTTQAATAAAVKTAYDAATAAAVWTESAGVLTPTTANNTVTIDVPQGIDGLTVEDSALGSKSLVAPGQVTLTDFGNSIVLDTMNTLVTLTADTGSGAVPGVLAVDETATPAPYNLQIGELQVNGDGGTSGHVLTSNGPGSAPTWQAGGGGGGGSPATPTVPGTVAGCTDSVNLNTALGYDVISSVTTGACNVAIGNRAACTLTDGCSNVAIGVDAMGNSDIAFNNIAIGREALLNSNLANNVAIGNLAGCCLTDGFQNVAIGSRALERSQLGVDNVAVGHRAMRESTEGYANVAVGACALLCSTGFENVALGCEAARLALSASKNVVIGTQAGLCLEAGEYNVFIGHGANPGVDSNCCLFIGSTGLQDDQFWLTGDSDRNLTTGTCLTVTCDLNLCGNLTDSTGNSGSFNQVLVALGGGGTEWKTVNSAIAAPNYGAYFHSSSQTPITPQTGQPVNFSQITSQNGVALTGGNSITIEATGAYNVQFSTQLISTSGASSKAEIWFVVNNAAISESNARVSFKGVNTEEIVSLNYVYNFGVGDVVQIFWAASDSGVSLYAGDSLYDGPRIPSATVSIVPVGA